MALAMVLSSGFVFTASADEELTPTCGHEEHKHDEKCYEKKLICELEETEESSTAPTPEPTATPEPAPVHVHTDECYETVTNLICGLEESEGTPTARSAMTKRETSSAHSRRARATLMTKTVTA